MIHLKSPEDIEKMRVASHIAAMTLHVLRRELSNGICDCEELNSIGEKFIESLGGRPAFKGYKPPFSDLTFEYGVCISINDEVVHGQPLAGKTIQEGDLVSFDLGVEKDGWYADAAISAVAGNYIGKVGSDPKVATALNLVLTTQTAIKKGIAAARLGNHIGDIGHAIQQVANAYGYSIAQGLTGHGIGRFIHEEPSVPNGGSPKTGIPLEEGMVICIEPMLVAGNGATRISSNDAWAVVTQDSSLAAHFEHVVAITAKGPVILSEY